MLSHSPTQKIFSSTNESNESMQKVFSANGFVRSGIIKNLDEGDPEIIFHAKKLRA
jgi:RimJ/RimL family protein N-acetyltransferase